MIQGFFWLRKFVLVDHATKSRLEDRIRELNFELSEIDEYVKGIKKQHNALKDEVNKLGKERVCTTKCDHYY